MLNEIQMILTLLCVAFASAGISAVAYIAKNQKATNPLPIYGNTCYNVKDKMQDTEVCIDDIIYDFKLLNV